MWKSFAYLASSAKKLTGYTLVLHGIQTCIRISTLIIVRLQACVQVDRYDISFMYHPLTLALLLKTALLLVGYLQNEVYSGNVDQLLVHGL